VSEYRHGLLIGKFYPPRVGHHAAIRAAASRCNQFTVLVMAAAVETVPLADRMAWLRDEHTADLNIRIAGIRCDAPVDVTGQQIWAAQVAAMRAALLNAGAPSSVDAVFCGDDYGTELARWFGATAVQMNRTGSSTSVRRALAGQWDELAAPTRAGLTTRVVVVGAESTGTTTVAERLARHYVDRGGVWAATQCVAEYGRAYTEQKWAANPLLDLTELLWKAEDFDAIGLEQTRREEAAARIGSPVLICDTDAFATAVWKRRYLGPEAVSGEPWTLVPPRAVYLLTDHQGVRWHDDGMREGDLTIRAAMTGWFADALTAAGHSWVLLTGMLAQRLDLAVRTIDPLLAHRARFGEPLHGPGFEGPP
jgi:HTH-type transcriptional repressor of NAD biosynthesis genes